MPEPPVTSQDVARRLLDAQVHFVLAELSGDRLAQVIVRDVDDLLALAATVTVAEVVDSDQVTAVILRLVERVGGSTLLAELVLAVTDAIYDLSASEEYDLGDVIARDPVEALVAKVLSMHTLQDRVLDRMAESPLVAAVASRFVTKIIGDFLQQNRQLAERLPGAKSLISFGMGAASKVRSATVDSFLGDAADKSTQFALKRTNGAVRDLIREAPLQGAAMQMWDLHAGEPIGDLREYLSKRDLRELVVLAQQLLTGARETEYAAAVVAAGVEVFFERYADHDLASLLGELGISGEDVIADAQRMLPPLIEAARRTGALERLLRDRLEPFYASAQVLAVLDGRA